jgi:hypothetical protein
VLPSFAQDTDEPRVRVAARPPSGIRNRVDHFDGTSSSTNWSGYAVTGTAFTSASASWVVPAAVCTGLTGRTAQYSSFWVGLDGWSSNSVEQTGTDSDCNGSRPSYYAWFEFYPQPSYEILNFPVNPGNVISASVVYNSTTNKFTVTVTNVTTGKTFSTSAAVASALRTSAEWIAEAPCCANRKGDILPMSDFGTVNFGFDYTSVANTNGATNSTGSGKIGSFPTATIQEVNKVGSTTSPQTSTCSALSADGTSFSCTWAPK